MRLRAKDQEIELRAGTVDDVPLLLSFIREMAEFEKLETTATETGLREALFGDRPAASTLIAFAGGRPAAYAVYFFTFATMVGKRGLWLDDLYVKPEFRGQGVGAALMSYLADLAVQNDCGCFEWAVLDWNRNAIDFYQRLAAKLLDGCRRSTIPDRYRSCRRCPRDGRWLDERPFLRLPTHDCDPRHVRDSGLLGEAGRNDPTRRRSTRGLRHAGHGTDRKR